MTKTLQSFPIIGVGASAGGIDSFKQFLNAIPENSGMAYVIVQHLDPTHQSSLPDILSRVTPLPVHDITDEVKLKPNHIYIMPENKMLSVTDHTLKLTARDTGIQNMPIDVFFRSLAQIHKTLAVGVVLSGTGHDGTNGLKEIKDNGGITFVEDPTSAVWNGMPQSAINAEVVDFILKPAEIPPALMDVHSSYKSAKIDEEEVLSDGEEDIFRQILAVIQIHSKVDFKFYKQPTLRRRIARRMAIKHAYTLEEYLQVLRKDKVEQQALFQDMLIQVSSFFKDPKTFDTLCKSILPELIENKKDNEPIRLWVPGCATGEEVYSLAICLQETVGGAVINYGFDGRKIQIFASDISNKAILKAREGVYTKNELQPVSENRLKNYFTQHNSHYKVNKDIRDIAVFANHNFLKDPPFARMDLISCRNVFIYMTPFLQQKALAIFHYALNHKGILLLGKAETTGASDGLFTQIHQQEKIFSRNAGASRFIPDLNIKRKRTSDKNDKEMVPTSIQPDFRKSADTILISGHTPPNVIVNEHLEVMQMNGTLSPFMKLPAGKPSFNLMKLVHDGLGFEIRNAMHKVKTTKVVVTKEDIPLHVSEERYSVSLEIIPLLDTVDPYYLILFTKKSAPISFWEKLERKVSGLWDGVANSELQNHNLALKEELAKVRQDMLSLSENQEATNEELQSANEELLSSNEKMQSLNEELETSKEELQSTNEELIILNQELIEKQEQLNDLLKYTEAIVATLREPILILEGDLQIRSSNEAFYKIFGVSENEVIGKKFFELKNGQWENEELRTLLYNVLPEKEVLHDFEMEIDFNNQGKRSLELNAREIVDGKKANKLILLVIEDVTERKDALDNYRTSIRDLEQTNEQLDNFVHVASHDLQEPLRKILTFSSRLRQKGKDKLSADMNTYLEKIEASSRRMSALIKNLLSYSLLAHHDEMFEKVDLNEIVGAVLPDFEVLIKEKKAEITIDSLPNIESIPLQMNQLFVNLIGNALKFSIKGMPPKIEIISKKLDKKEVKSFESLNPDLGYAEIIVKDYGIGFNPQYEKQIFTIFQRLNQPSEYAGTGIGLAMVKRIVENHHGEIFAQSKEGKGAEFHVIIPLQRPAH